MRAFTLPLVTVLALSGCVGTFTYDYPAAPETEEADRLHLEGLGQLNCMREAQANTETSRCGFELTGANHPWLGILVLDAFYTTTAGPSQPMPLATSLGAYDPEDPNAGRPDQIAHDAIRGTNLARASENRAPDVIAPGPGQWVALFGWWDNHNWDGTLSVRTDAATNEDGSPRWNATNEWIPVENAQPLGFLEPGSRPQAESWNRPGSSEPDFTLSFVSSGSVYATGTSPIVFVDGSLAQTFRSMVVSAAVLVPSANGLPFTPVAGARVDVDVYAALAPGPVVGLYASTVAGVVNEVGSPSYGSCPDGCEVQRLPATGTAADALTEMAGTTLWSPYPREWREGEGGTGAGRGSDYLAGYQDWIDLLPKTKILHPYDVTPLSDTVPLVGGSRGGRPTMAPGLLAVEVRIGLFRDDNGDGFVGAANPGQPYESGRRPLPDDYLRSNGEYLPLAPMMPNPGFDGRTFYFNVTLIPDTDWGPGVTIAHWAEPADRALGRDRSEACYELTAAASCADPSRTLVTGREPLVLAVGSKVGFPGLFTTDRAILMPMGSPGFVMCTEPLLLAWATGDETQETAWIHDCDSIAPWR